MKRQKTSWRGILTLLLASLFISISAWSCDSALRTRDTNNNQAVISKADGEPIKTISASAFYNTDSEYLDKVIEHLSKNGNAIVKAYNREAQLKTRVGQTVALSFNQIQSTGRAAADKTNVVSLLDDLSSHIRVKKPDGEIDEYVLTLRKAYSGGRIATNQTALSKTGTWVALDPERFHVKEDEQGNEIYPVTFPAYSMKNPDVKVEVTLHRNGTLTWPSGVTPDFSSNIAASVQQQMMYVTAVPVLSPNRIEPCTIDDPRPECYPDDPYDPPGDDGGDEPTIAADELQKDYKVPFLAIKTLRFIASEPGSKEISMFVAPANVRTANPYVSTGFSKKWDYIFDVRAGKRNQHIVFGDGDFYSTATGILGIINLSAPYIDVKGTLGVCRTNAC